MNLSKRSGNQMQIIVRPEIRKGCVWELQFKFSDAVVASMTEFSLIENNPQKLPVLILTVKSKLIQTELPFTKVGQILNDGSNIIINKSNIALLNVKFTSRPRTVFHRHSDVMILSTVIKKGDHIICSDEIELIFRGGTGSIHSADNKKESPSQGFVRMEFREPLPMHPGILKGEHGPLHPGDPLFFPGHPPMIPRPEGYEGGPELVPQTFEEFMRAQNPMWTPEGGVPFQELHHFHQMAAQQFHQPQQFHPPHLQHLQHHLPPHLQHPHLLPPHPQQLQQLQIQQLQLQQQLQQQQQQQQQQAQSSEAVQQEEKAQDEEKDPQAQEIEESQVKETEDEVHSENATNSTAFPKKQIQRRTENSGFQHLFFTCLSNMGLTNVSAVCATAQTPVFVTNLQSEIIYANPAFHSFIAEVAEVDNEFPTLKDLQAVFDSLAADRSSNHDKLVLTSPEKSMNTSADIIQKYPCLFVKQWANLSDGQTVIICMVVPGQTSLDSQ